MVAAGWVSQFKNFSWLLAENRGGVAEGKGPGSLSKGVPTYSDFLYEGSIY